MMELAIILAAFTATTLIFIMVYRRLRPSEPSLLPNGVEVPEDSLKRFGELLDSEGLGEVEEIYGELRRLRMEVERRLEEGG